MTRKPHDSQPRLSVTSLSQYVKVNNCDRYLRFRLEPRLVRKLAERWDVNVQPLTPLLRESGLEFEQRVVDKLAERGELVVNLDEKDPEDTIKWLSSKHTPVILLQASLEGPLGNYECRGRADVIRLAHDADGGLQVYIADVKSSRQERMEHRLQVATYAHLLRGMAETAGTQISCISGSVMHMQGNGEVPELEPDVPGFDLDTYTTILNHLALDEDSTMGRLARVPLDEVFFHLGRWCDGCIYNPICMFDAAERLDLSLVQGITATEKRALHATGISSLPVLAGLLELPGQGQRELTVAPGQEERVHALSQQWAVAPKLPILVQRAKRALRRFDHLVRAPSFLYGAGYGSLPDDNEHPQLVKIFFDAQYDYLRNRVYLLSALVSGPSGQHIVVEHTHRPPDDELERALLLKWVRGILDAAYAARGDDYAPIHLYCYNRYDQWALLEALKRHLEAVALLPGFFDMMTQSPATSQPIISFLATELEERFNQGMVCAPLHDAARALGFDWRDDRFQFFHIFRRRMFDNRHHVVRRRSGQLVPAPRDLPQNDPNFAIIESASRFNSQIPLEYAYGAWDMLPEADEDRTFLEAFRKVSLEQLIAFAAHRTRALAHIEGAFKYKARFIDKPPIDLGAIERGDAPEAALALSLQEFLFMEHHAAFQAKMQVYAMPIEQRIQTGLALLLRFDSYDHLRGAHRFCLEFESIGLDPVLAMNALRLKEGAWVVINGMDQPQSPGRIKNGRLAVIKDMGPDWIELKLLDFGFRQTRFRYYHKTDLAPEKDKLYTLDEMADDMNADKALEALNNAVGNALYGWLMERPAPRSQPEEQLIGARRFAELVDQIERPHSLTGAQREVVGGHLEEPLFLVQGPPGTGKSHTLGWAVLSRLIQAAAEGRPCRIAVSSKTHNAVNIVLESVASKWRKVLEQAADQISGSLKLGFQMYKLVNDIGEEVPAGVFALDAYAKKPADLELLLEHPFLVVGGTPGGLYNLAKYRDAGGKGKVDWSLKTFDLVVIDEASQMGLPEAVLACAFLREEGNLIVVGDHRQMPPIIAHDWEEEYKRTAVGPKPYLSLFESLVERGFPRVSLDESFRLHQILAQFLQDNIYVRDGIHFFSRRTSLLPKATDGYPYVDFALAPEYPIIVIEHEEQASQQFNRTELAILQPIVAACTEQLGLAGSEGIGIVVPHRAQKAFLRERFPMLAQVQAIDTVERFQGGERDVIIVSATASDPDYVLAEADFLLNLNRLNVALSRPRKKLIVVASRSVTRLLVSDLNTFENAVIWKRLFYQHASSELWRGSMDGIGMSVRGCAAA